MTAAETPTADIPLGALAEAMGMVVVEARPERVVITADAAAPALLVLTDTHYPGWRARVDGTETEIIRANGLFRAVPVPAGRHEVVFSYEPASLRRGAIVSALAALLLVGVPIVSLVIEPS